MAEENPTQTIYRFFDPVGARLTLETGELKIGKPSEFNDPFDFSFGFDPDSSLPEVDREQIIKQYLKRFEEHFGVICFCREWPPNDERDPIWTDPILWGHYAARHCGIALGFSNKAAVETLGGNHVWEICYTKVRPWFPTKADDSAGIGYEALKSAGQSKSLSWKYEHETRLIVPLDDPRIKARDGNYLLPIQDGFLTRIILGDRCPFTEDYVRKAIAGKPYEDVPIQRASMSKSEYKMEIK